MRFIALVPVFALVLLAQPASNPNPGSAFAPSGRYGNLFADNRARSLGDLVTIVVVEQLAASSSGASSSQRESSASGRIGSVFGDRSAIGALSNLANIQGSSQLDGTASTSRSNSLTTTITGQIVEVLPNGDFVIEAHKSVLVNSEKNQLDLRALLRWNDVTTANTVRSDRLGNVQIKLNGKGLVSDAIRRPNLLYRILLGLLPF
ncbi:MAG: flagellar basal body L-ring protein FlgH [Bryobacter sp.]